MSVKLIKVLINLSWLQVIKWYFVIIQNFNEQHLIGTAWL